MTNGSKTIKFQMMLSESEAKAIDDWSFANRIRSRAEAIRRLCAVGISSTQTKPEGNPVPNSSTLHSKTILTASSKPMPDGVFLPRSKVRQRYGISEMTMWRLENNQSAEFPSPIIVNRRKFYRVDELSVWEAKRSVE